jgi:hypothetical protein
MLYDEKSKFKCAQRLDNDDDAKDSIIFTAAGLKQKTVCIIHF